MSCDWNIHCLDCNVTLGFDDADHRDAAMRTMIEHASAIAALAPLLEDWQFELRFSSYGRTDAKWFVAHLGHKLQPIDEYGRLDDQCYERVKCACCGTSKDCTLKRDHEGEHAHEAAR